MKKYVLLGLILFTIHSVSAQERRTTPRIEPLDQQPITLQRYSGSYSYNPLRYGGLYIGHLYEKNPLFSASMGYRTKPDSVHSILFPYLTSNRPDKNYFSFYYGPNFITDNFSQFYTQKLALHQFGIGFAVQTDDGFFRFAIDGDAYAGNVKFEGSSNDDDKRLVLGVENFGVAFSWNPENIVAIVLSAHANGFIDTLTVTGANIEDRFSEVMLPLTKLGVYVNSEDVPYRMGLDLGYGRRHFVYSTTNPGNVNGQDLQGPGNNSSENADAIVTDSLTWKMQHQGDIKAGEHILIQPSITLGQDLAWKKRMIPGTDNYPFVYDGEILNHNWDEREFFFGGGINLHFDDFVGLWFEFDRTSFNGQEAQFGVNMSGRAHEQSYNRIGLGTTFSAHNLPNVDFKGTTVDLDVSFAQTAQRSADYNSHQFHINENSNGSQVDRYQLLLGNYVFNDFTLGLRSTFKDDMLGLAFKMAFIKETTNAIESDAVIGFDFTYNLTTR